MKTLSLTDEEAYILACVMWHVKSSRSGGALFSILDKLDSVLEKDITCEDYDRVSFSFDTEKNQITNVQIEFN